MAVKKHDLGGGGVIHVSLAGLAQMLQQLTAEQAAYHSSPEELLQRAHDIVKCLVRIPVAEGQHEEDLNVIEEFLLSMVRAADAQLRQDIMTIVVQRLHGYISDPQCEAGPSASIVLIVLEGCEAEEIRGLARWLLLQNDGPAADAGIRCALSVLLQWLHSYYGSGVTNLAYWVDGLVKALVDLGSFDILTEVALEHIEPLFLALTKPQSAKQPVSDFILYTVACMRESYDALERLDMHISIVLASLAADSSPWSRQMLQNAVDILTAMVSGLLGRQPGLDAQDEFRVKFCNVIDCLEWHMASHEVCRFLEFRAWTPDYSPPSPPGPDAVSLPSLKKGLLNLGNTCYMNSVMQALFFTRQFSNHVMVKMPLTPYWARMGVLFAKMNHSLAVKLNPLEVVSAVKPPFFTMDNQHDSSEFLVYLFMLLQAYEHYIDPNFDYVKPHPTLNMRLRTLANAANMPPRSGYPCFEYSMEPGRRSQSPRPGGSGGSGSSSNKRASPEHMIAMPPKKRYRSEPSLLRQNSFVDTLFGGVLLTRVECTECHFSSLSRDVFRDLQLSFPEKPEPGRQHSVQSLLEYYCTTERLTGDNRYECPDCRGKRDAERSVLIDTSPKYLILVLKNFRYEQKLKVQTKLMHSMQYNYTVHLPNVRSGAEPTYQVYAAVIHAGTTLDSGHYYTLANDNGQWHLFNDDVVDTSSDLELNSLTNASTPYILFYRRVDIDELAPPPLADLPESVQEAVLSHNKHYVDSIHNRRITRP